MLAATRSLVQRTAPMGRVAYRLPASLASTPLASAPLSTEAKMVAPPMAYIAGEEMTHHCMNLIMESWINPHIDTSKWEFFDLSCVGRDATDDQVLHDAVEAGARIGAIFKEPTITPTEVQQKELGLKRAYGSPNGAMRKGWNGITISRDTIHIEGLRLGYKDQVFFERHAVGGEYGASHATVGPGTIRTKYYPEDENGEIDNDNFIVVDERQVVDKQSAVVTYHNPLDNVADLAHHFFSRCLDAGVVPYVVTKKTVFKWQEGFWLIMLDVFNQNYKQQYLDAGLLNGCGGELQHLISDAATMQIVRWTDGGFGMAAHNYDGDMLTDEISQVHRSPGFINSSLIGKRSDGAKIMEFEASHGTVADMWHDHLAGKETSLNPLGMVEALIGAIQHAAKLQGGQDDITAFTNQIRSVVHKAMAGGMGTRDLSGPTGLTTEEFVAFVGRQLDGMSEEEAREAFKMDQSAKVFAECDSDSDGKITQEEAMAMLKKLRPTV